MQFEPPLIPATLIRRYKRFLADVHLDDGTALTAHCPNTGSMLGCQEPGARVWLSRSDRPSRKYPHTWELVESSPGVLVGIHTGRSNRLVEEALKTGMLADRLGGFDRIRREVTLPGGGSRIDFVLEGPAGEPPCYLEVKNVTAAVEDGVALFPDAVSTRGTRHMRHLAELASQGARAALVFCVQRDDVAEVRPADAIDPAYGLALREAIAAGVEVCALGARVSPRRIALQRRLPVICPQLDAA
ncbi:sugar fermentation stimulation protein A [Natronocella acetinitrilica]|uniref:Sugar fermentation stimulation protein homolog n=1 Tax=Natronocella acetinitrilica TaxID=414046 RepID=A0AAE3G743_9GAMM|nr:DNA/RNA nuclease SfsA [Natronocella acetinitrilica]MCP1676274.1 sugar fermentation stimulation protein A [Natronocella acetinitrilica]